MENLLGKFVLTAFFIAYYFAARGPMFENGELFASTPDYDMKNVKSKYFRIRIALFFMCFLPTVSILASEILTPKFANTEMQRAISIALKQYHYVTVIMFGFFAICAKGTEPGKYFEIFEEPYILTRYMIYPRLWVSAFTMTGITCSLFGAVAGFVYPYFESNITIRNGLNFPFSVLCFVLEIALVYFANYAIIGWYDNTSRDFLFDKVEREDYDKAAKRYYGIWRNRLILANAAAGTQLVLGGFATLTNAGKHLAGIRYLGIVVLVIVFSYILIQSRDFDAPIIVKGMVYPSEKKRITLNRIVLASVIVYIIGAIILL